MSVIMINNESFFDILWKYTLELIEMTYNVFKFITAIGSIILISYILYNIHEHVKIFQTLRFFTYTTKHYDQRVASKSKHNSTKSHVIKDYNRSLIRCQSIISHKEMLNALQFAADKCSEKCYALKCIDIVVCCPQLLNIKSPLSGLTPFHRICFQGHAYLIAFMLAKGADPYLTTISGENALCMAIYHFLNNPTKNDFSCLEMLLQTGCEFGSENKWHNILLKMAYNRNHVKLVQWLILHNKTSSKEIVRCSSTPPVSKN